MVEDRGGELQPRKPLAAQIMRRDDPKVIPTEFLGETARVA